MLRPAFILRPSRSRGMRSGRPTRQAGAWLTVIMCLAAGATVESAETAHRTGDQENIRKVMRGDITQANAAWWGFDPQDATESLEKALGSGAKSVVIPNVGQPWIVSRELRLRSNLDLIFEDGAEVLARQGAFHGKTASLFSAANVSNITMRGNATLRMRKSDYADPELYVKAEWRMGIKLYGCRDVRIEGLTITQTGGDGIYVGASESGPAYCENVTIRNVVCDDNYRQGISVISAVNLLIEDCVFRNTSGTVPATGLDFEPNRSHEVFRQVTVRRCVFENNDGGEMVFYGARLNKTGAREPISILFDRCRVTSSSKTGIAVGALREGAPGGVIEFRDCVIENTGQAGAYVFDKHPGAALVRFTRCAFRNVANDPPRGKSNREAPGSANAPLVVHSWRPKTVTDVNGGIEFVDCSVVDDVDRPVLIGLVQEDTKPFRDIRGRIYTDVPGTARCDLPETASAVHLEFVAGPSAAHGP